MKSWRVFAWFELIVLCGLGLAMIVASFVWRVPNKKELVQHSEHLLSFYVLHQSNRPWFPGKSRTWYDVVWYTSEGGRYFSESLNEYVATQALQRRGAVLDFYMKPNQRAYTLDNGEHALPTYGLSVEGREIEPLASALAQERDLARFAFPLIGAGLIGVGLLAFRQDTRRGGFHLTNR
jgi:hypothetical protein